jgi:hypothetical protein
MEEREGGRAGDIHVRARGARMVDAQDAGPVPVERERAQWQGR